MTGFISGKNVDTLFKWKIDEGQPKSAAGGFQVVQDSPGGGSGANSQYNFEIRHTC